MHNFYFVLSRICLDQRSSERLQFEFIPLRKRTIQKRKYAIPSKFFIYVEKNCICQLRKGKSQLRYFLKEWNSKKFKTKRKEKKWKENTCKTSLKPHGNITNVWFWHILKLSTVAFVSIFLFIRWFLVGWVGGTS